MKINLVFYFSDECRNSVASLVAGINYFCKERKIEIRYAGTADSVIKNLSSSYLNLIAFSVTTVNFYDIYRVFSRMKRETANRNNFVFIAGGPHADGEPDSLINAGFDIVFSGYSEESFAHFLNELSESGSCPESGIISSETSEVWHKRSFAKYANNYFPPLEIQRGCRFKCSYCQSCTRLRKPVYKSRDAIDEYVEDFKMMGFKRFSFVSPDAFDIRFSSKERSPDNISSLFDYLTKKGIKIIEYGQFPSEIRPRSDTGIYFSTLARYTKNRKVVIGAQSFLGERLQKIRRSHTVQDIEATLDAAAGYGFYSIVDIIVGFPDETKEERLYTLNRFRELNKKYPSRLHVHYFLPLAGTEMYYTSPSEIDNETLRLLERLEKDGRAKGWWREGRLMTDRIVMMRERFSVANKVRK
ncbi:MAG: TIGR04013 family B12-binding domain/radical SAM domain-containing protein [Deltaproteobacteria bacterium]|nr:TIGR04013 family B12-binding domain/radical SAM domain-containing protein [Deltaproteobacteria bacterium]